MASEFKQMLKQHKTLLNENINIVINELITRSQEHDMDKLYDPRVASVYEKHFADLKKIPFGTAQYLEYEREYFTQAHMLHAQARHHFYSSKNKKVNDPNLIDLLEAVIDIYVSNKQYNDELDIDSIIKTMKIKGLMKVSLEEYIYNTIKNLEQNEKKAED